MIVAVWVACANVRVNIKKRHPILGDISSIEYRSDVIKTKLNGNISQAILVYDFEEFTKLNSENIRVSLKNFKELQYYGSLYLGSNREKLEFVYDTGSSWLWFPKSTCKGWPTKTGYNTKSSVFYNETNQVTELFYGKGHVVGNISYDHVSLMSTGIKSVPLKMLAVNSADDLEGTQADGILGLSPEPKTGAESLVKKLASEGVIDSAQFSVYIGSVDEESYVEFGSYHGNNDNVTWVPLTDTNYWRVYINSFSYKSQSLKMKSQKAVLDTGSSIIGFPREDLKTIIFAVKEDRQLYYLEDINFYGVRCQSVNDFYDIIVDIGGHTTRISANDYMIKLNEYCIFFLFDLGTSMNFILLGDTYLKGSVMIHDIDRKRVGLFPQKLYYKPRDFKQVNIFLYLLIGLVSVGILAIIGFVIYKNYLLPKERETDQDYELMGERA